MGGKFKLYHYAASERFFFFVTNVYGKDAHNQTRNSNDRTMTRNLKFDLRVQSWLGA